MCSVFRDFHRYINHAFGFAFLVMESGEANRDCCITPEFNTNQCIFYPVKEEEREVLLGPAQTSGGSLTPEGSGDAHQTEHQTAESTLREFLLFLVIFSVLQCVLEDVYFNVECVNR